MKGQDWQLFADGLHEVLGIYIDPVGEDIWVMQRRELTQLVDRDGDSQGRRLSYHHCSLGIDGQLSCEYAFGLVRDAEVRTWNAQHQPELRWVGPEVQSGISVTMIVMVKWGEQRAIEAGHSK